MVDKYAESRPRSVRWTERFLWFFGTIVVVGTGFLVSLDRSSPAAQSSPMQAFSGGSRPFRVVAMGDSYMSGEGAAVFYDTTDVPYVNSCRRSPTAYPVRLVELLPDKLNAIGRDYSGVELTFVACSGATTTNIGSRFEDFKNFEDEEGTGVPQYSNEALQVEALKAHPNADVVLLSIGGNDARFSDVIMTCSGEKKNCIPVAERWLQHLDAFVQPRLWSLYQEVRAITPDALIYVVKYPNPFGSTRCDDINLDEQETRFLRDVFIPRLNQQIAMAAIGVGLREIDLTDAFGSQGLCGATQPLAMNGFRWQRTSARLSLPDHLLRGSMHPTSEGHALIASRIAERIVADVQHPGPPIDWNQGYVPGIPMGCPPGITDCGPMPPPPFQPSFGDVPLPTGPKRLEENPNPCTNEAPVTTIASGSGARTELTGVLPGSRVCYQSFKGNWQTMTAGSDGTVVVDFKERQVAGIGGFRHVLYQQQNGEWVWLTELPPLGAQASILTPFEAWLGVSQRWVVLSVVLLGLTAAWLASLRVRLLKASA